MTSRLASLLVQEGRVSAKKMAQAFQRQVIYGGTLDTILLEMDVIDEPSLVEAMGRASALATAGDLPSREWLESAGAKDWFPHALSDRFRAVPVSLEGNVLRVLVTDPPDRKQLDELGYLLSRSIDPIVVPEHRFAHAVEMVYGIAIPARFASLAAKVRQRAAEAPVVAPVARAVAPRVVQIDADLPPSYEKLPPLQSNLLTNDLPDLEGPTLKMQTVVPPPEAHEAELMKLVEPEPEAKIAPQPRRTPVPLTDLVAPMQPEAPSKARSVVSDVPMPSSVVPSVVVDVPTPRQTTRQADAPAPVAREVTVLSANAPTDAVPLPLADAARHIEAAPDRDTIFAALCRGARSQLDFVSLLMVHGEVAVGRLALGGDWLPREQVAQLSIPLDKPSPFRAAVMGKAPYLGRLGEEVVSVRALESLGRKPPVPAVLLPIVLKERTVALLYADANGKPIDAALLADLSTAVAATARAFQRLILHQKSGEFGKAKGTDAKMSAAALPDRTGNAGNGAPGWRPAEPAGGSHEEPKARLTVRGFAALSNAMLQDMHDAPTASVPTGPAMTDADALVASVIKEDEHAARSAEALVLLGDRAVEAVVKQVPGPLRLARHLLRGPTPPLAEHGPLLAVLRRLGASALRPLLQRAQDPSLEVRYYVALALGEIGAAEAVPALGQRLFDADAGVRHAAMQALRGMSASNELRNLTESLRGELPGPEIARQRFASEAIGALRDVPSVPRLIELVKHADDQLVAAARRALVEITKQDFGTSRWRWRSWWERHRHEPRVEWMLEGLGHSEADVRLSASEELRALSSDYFGYHFDLPKREREDARRRWIEWWRAQGAKKPQDRS